MYISQLLQHAPVSGVLFIVAVAILGAAAGSFASSLAWRKIHGRHASTGRSHSRCPHCGHDLTTGDLIPVISWIYLRGRCRYCSERISIRYVASELILAAVFVALIWCYGVTIQGIALCAFGLMLLALSLTDLEARIIPNKYLLISLAIWLAAMILAALTLTGALPQIYTDFCTFGVIEGTQPNPAFAAGSMLLGSPFLQIAGGNTLLAVLADSLSGALIISALMLACAALFGSVTGKSGLGAGDIKLFFVTGLFLGLIANLLNLMLSCIIGAVFGVIFTRSQDGASTGAFPFGPAIATSTVICLIFSPVIMGVLLT